MYWECERGQRLGQAGGALGSGATAAVNAHMTDEDVLQPSQPNYNNTHNKKCTFNAASPPSSSSVIVPIGEANHSRGCCAPWPLGDAGTPNSAELYPMHVMTTNKPHPDLFTDNVEVVSLLPL